MHEIMNTAGNMVTYFLEKFKTFVMAMMIKSLLSKKEGGM
jgi:hypothetical protein